ncbi:ankyrin repeat-containing domain protein [Pelagophyceae sp. CCMP2097]|nr:ankyrin repeat-containing domain protein [Pelagophyceae sp. CCMP2097]
MPFAWALERGVVFAIVEYVGVFSESLFNFRRTCREARLACAAHAHVNEPEQRVYAAAKRLLSREPHDASRRLAFEIILRALTNLKDDPRRCTWCPVVHQAPVHADQPSALQHADAEALIALAFRRRPAVGAAVHYECRGDPVDVRRFASKMYSILSRCGFEARLAEAGYVDVSLPALQRWRLGGATRLVVAVLRHDFSEVEALVGLGVDVDCAGDGPLRPLHAAVLGGREHLVWFLLRHGASAAARDARGDTPLHLAAARWLAAVAQRLLAAGADADAVNARGETPLQTLCSSDGPDDAPAAAPGAHTKRRHPVAALRTAEVLLKHGAALRARGAAAPATPRPRGATPRPRGATPRGRSDSDGDGAALRDAGPLVRDPGRAHQS